MIQQTFSLRCIAANKPEMLPDTFQMFESSLFVLRVAINRDGQQPQLRADHFNDREGNAARVGKKIALPPKRTELNGESQSVGGSAALVHLLQVRLRQREVLPECIVIELIRQAPRLFQPIIWAKSVTARRGRVQEFAPL